MILFLPIMCSSSNSVLFEKQLASHQLILSFEGFTPKSIKDNGKNVYSIGYGTRGKKNEVITKEEAGRRMNKYLIDNVFPKINKDFSIKKYAAIASFAYNTGVIPKNCNTMLKKKYTLPGSKFEKGLKKRRIMEYNLCMKGEKL